MKFLVKENASYLVEQFRKVKVLSVLSDTELRTIVSQMRSFEFKAGTRIVNQGELANLFFIVQTGSVEVSVKKNFFWEKRLQSSAREISLVKVFWSLIPGGPLL